VYFVLRIGSICVVVFKDFGPNTGCLIYCNDGRQGKRLEKCPVRTEVLQRMSLVLQKERLYVVYLEMENGDFIFWLALH